VCQPVVLASSPAQEDQSCSGTPASENQVVNHYYHHRHKNINNTTINSTTINSVTIINLFFYTINFKYY